MNGQRENGLPSCRNSSTKKNVKETLSCPVCDRLPVPPVYGCQNGHFICESCRMNVRHCAICRAERFNVRCLVVEDLLASKVLPCEYLSLGCHHPLMDGHEYTRHLINCPFRPVECECKDGISDCRSQPVPYTSYVDHLKDFHGATRTTKKSCFISCDMYGSFAPKYFDCFNHTFILMSHRNQTRFWTWIAILERTGSASAFNFPDPASAAYYIRLKLRYKLRRQDVQFITSDVFTPSSLRDTPEEVVKSGKCLEFDASTIPNSVPPCVWPQYEQYDEDEGYIRWGYDVEIWEPNNIIVRVPTLRRTFTPQSPAIALPATQTNDLSLSLNRNANSNSVHSELNTTTIVNQTSSSSPANANNSANVNSSLHDPRSDDQIFQLRPEEPVPFQVPPTTITTTITTEARPSLHPPAFPVDIDVSLPLPLSNLQQLQQQQQPHLPNPNPHLFQLDFDFSDHHHQHQLSRRWEGSCILGDEDDYSSIGDEDFLNELELDTRVRDPLPLPLHVDVDDRNINNASPLPEPQRKRTRLDLNLDPTTNNEETGPAVVAATTATVAVCSTITAPHGDTETDPDIDIDRREINSNGGEILTTETETGESTESIGIDRTDGNN